MLKTPKKAAETAGATKEPSVGELLKGLWESIKKWDGKEALAKVVALITAVSSKKLSSLKDEVEKTRKKQKKAEKNAPKDDVSSGKKNEKSDVVIDESSLESVKPQAATSTSGLPEGLEMKNGKPLYNKANILKCKTIEQCRALMKANGFVLDEGSGNYINPRYITPSKILKEPLVKSKIGTQTITLKRSVMIRLKKADASLFAETGEHIRMHQHFRKNSLQLKLFHRLAPKKARVAGPGHSFHEIGQAIDVSNWEKASKHLWNQGFVGGKLPIGLSGDANHFSIKEIRVTPKRKVALEKEIGKPWETVA